MIGILAKLTKAAKMAQTAEAAIDIASNRISQDSGEKKLAGVTDDFEPMLEAGVPDPRELLTADEVAEIVGKRVRSISLAATADCLVCDYHCKDSSGTTLGVHVSNSLPWAGFEAEIEKKEIFDELGDAAFRGGRRIYVKSGDTVFWIHTAGEVMVDMAVQAARLVVPRLRSEGID